MAGIENSPAVFGAGQNRTAKNASARKGESRAFPKRRRGGFKTENLFPAARVSGKILPSSTERQEELG